MDRGTDALKTIVGPTTQMDIRQTRKGWFQECLGCEAQNEFKYFVDGNQVAYSLDESGFCCRLLCPQVYPFKTLITEAEGSTNELLTVEREFVCCPVGACKCCCYQGATMTSGGEMLGSIVEQFWCCVPKFLVTDENSEALYKLSPPTCCAGMCINCCAEGNPCGKGCCKVSLRVYPADQEDTDGDASYIGKILKQPKSLMTEMLTDADSFLVDYPDSATAAQKGLLMGSAIFFNATFFEGQEGNY